MDQTIKNHLTRYVERNHRKPVFTIKQWLRVEWTQPNISFTKTALKNCRSRFNACLPTIEAALISAASACNGLPYVQSSSKHTSFMFSWHIKDWEVVWSLRSTHGSLDVPLAEFLTRAPCSSLRGHYLKLHHRRFRLNRRVSLKSDFFKFFVNCQTKSNELVNGERIYELKFHPLNAHWT